MLRSLGLSTKILAVVAVLVVAVVAANYGIFMPGYAHAAKEAMMAKAAAFTAVADEAKNHAGHLQNEGAFDVEKLVTEAQAALARGDSYTKTRFFGTIPVVAGWTAAQKAAEREHIDFHVIAFDARNKEHEPDKGTFGERLLRDLTDQVRANKGETIGRINPETNTMHYLRAIRLEESCMMCHGDPAKYDSRDENGKFDGKDALGFAMESWKPGDMHGAYEVAMPLKEMDAQIAGFFNRGMLVTIPIVVLSMGGFWFLLRVLMTRPVNGLICMIRDVAEGDGDLTKRLALNRGDELGQLGKWFDKFLENLHKIIGEVKRTTNEVASAATEISASAEQMAAGLSKQEEQTMQVSSAVTEMSQSVMEVARKSADAATAASESGKEAGGGGEVVAKSVVEMKAIADQVNASAAVVGELGKKGEQIGQIIDVINDIAEQTNLLALNAAIEAARAGEHGRGFAVVADEVRKLAERTTKATEEVAVSIREIQGDTATAVKQIEDGTRRVSTGVDLVNAAGTSLGRIVAASDNVKSMVQAIAAASEQQSAASEEIARSVESISAITKESSQGASQTAQAVSQLSAQAERLRALVDRFRL
ncbi:MAG: methyl-accepting chemotaxis protein [Phycisphaerales bacterium]|nr:methyl-accepting chemotaxis protein [Phycisphaerales bacterium]